MQLACRPAAAAARPAPRAARRPGALRVDATAVPAYVPPSPGSLDRPAGGGSRSFDPPRSSDISYWGPSSDLMRPSGGANRGAVFAAAAAPSDGGLVDRPGGRGGRGDAPSSSDVPPPVDPASARPGGRGGRDMSLSGGGDAPSAPVSLDRPGGRSGRGGPGGGDDGGAGGSGGGGGSGGDGSGAGGAGAGGGGFGKAVGSVALYAGVIAAAWAGHSAFFAPKPEPAKPCCAGKGKGKGKK
ncbi:hypothetical protein HT031_005467 [Scenedesmus sp. PABB004]|nr:hypothetical protein HT031_005467 [Scenedesmus sp. PABB004]